MSDQYVVNLVRKNFESEKHKCDGIESTFTSRKLKKKIQNQKQNIAFLGHVHNFFLFPLKSIP